MNSLLPTINQAALLQPVGGPRHNTAVKKNPLLIFLLRKISSIVRKKIHHGIGIVRRIVDSLIVKNKLMMFLCNTFLLFFSTTFSYFLKNKIKYYLIFAP
jgi:hypothetical protein